MRSRFRNDGHGYGVAVSVEAIYVYGGIFCDPHNAHHSGTFSPLKRIRHRTRAL